MAKERFVPTETHYAFLRALKNCLESTRGPSSVPELAKQSKISERSINYWLKMEKDAQLGSIVRIASTFKLQAWAMLYTEGNPDLIKVLEAYKAASPDQRLLMRSLADTILGAGNAGKHGGSDGS